MTMRRLPKLLLIAAAGGTVLSVGVLAALVRPCPSRGCPMSAVAHALARFAPPLATAQEVMQFKRVPAESVADVVRPRRRRGSEPAPAAVPPAPAAPSPPSAAPTPDADVDVHIGEGDLHADRSGDVVRFGSNIHVRAGQRIAGDVVAMGGDVTVDGHVEGDVVAMGGDVIVNPTGEVDGQVVTLGGHLREEPGSHVRGQRVQAGGLPRGWGGWPFLGFMGLVGSGLKAAMAIAKMFFMLLVAWGFTQLAPNRTRTAFDAFKRETLMCFGIGLLAWALVIPSIVALALVVAILCITIIGIPLALAVLLGYVLGLMLLVAWGYVVGAAALGERLAHQLGRSAPTLTIMAVWGIVGITVIRVVGHLFGGIPMGGFPGGMLVLLSGVISCVLVTIGAGALLRTQARREQIGQWWTGARAAAGHRAAPGGAASASGTPAAPPMSAPSPMPPVDPTTPAPPASEV
jgi:hypothetical protein